MIHHYYHIYADGIWREPVAEHCEALKSSGLSAQPEFTFNIGIVGNAENAARVRNFLREQQLGWREIAYAAEGWEQVTLAALWKESHAADGLALYAHTKGAHDPNEFNRDWRRRMTELVVRQWRDAIAPLRTHHACGCHWMQLEGNWLFGGNFWWAHMRDLRLLPPPQSETRWQAEEWVGQLARYIDNFSVYDPAPPFPGNITTAKTARD